MNQFLGSAANDIDLIFIVLQRDICLLSGSF